MVVKIYITSVSSNLKIKKDQQRIMLILDSKKIAYETIDIATGDEHKQKMRELCGNEKAIPPQLFNEDEYLGDFEAFDNAVEMETVDEFLKL